MSRLPLIHIPNGFYSVVSKCNNNEFLFDAADKFELYLRHLIYCKKKLGFKIYDIVCMSNHVHELYQVPENGIHIGNILHTVKGHFTQKFNKLFYRSNHFWRNKPRYRVVENERYALNTCNYFHWNPVRANMVDHPSKWPYSGYRFFEMNDKSGPIGQLLDVLPGYQYPLAMGPKQIREMEGIASLLKQKGLRFIGSRSYIKTMEQQY